MKNSGSLLSKPVLLGKVYGQEKVGREQRHEGGTCHLVVQDLKHTLDWKEVQEKQATLKNAGRKWRDGKAENWGAEPRGLTKSDWEWVGAAQEQSVWGSVKACCLGGRAMELVTWGHTIASPSETICVGETKVPTQGPSKSWIQSLPHSKIWEQKKVH